jgi:hypothetical protein
MTIRNRRTKADREAEYSLAEIRVWNDFVERLATLRTLEDALKLVDAAPPPDAPGRRFYSNLGFFLQYFAVPFGSGATERSLYLRFIARLDEAGVLKPDARGEIEAAFRAAARPVRA